MSRAPRQVRSRPHRVTHLTLSMSVLVLVLVAGIVSVEDGRSPSRPQAITPIGHTATDPDPRAPDLGDDLSPLVAFTPVDLSLELATPAERDGLAGPAQQLKKWKARLEKLRNKRYKAEQKLLKFQAWLNDAQADLAAAEAMPEDTPQQILAKYKAIQKANTTIAEQLVKVAVWSAEVTEAALQVAAVLDDIHVLEPGYEPPPLTKKQAAILAGLLEKLEKSQARVANVQSRIEHFQAQLAAAQQALADALAMPTGTPKEIKKRNKAIAKAEKRIAFCEKKLGLWSDKLAAAEGHVGVITAFIVALVPDYFAGNPLVVSETQLSFSTPDVLAATFAITNTGPDAVSWIATSSNGWLELDLPGGDLLPGASQTVGVTAQADGLSAGAHAATISVNLADEATAPKTIGVSLLVSGSSGAIEATVQPNRTFGVAPLAVFFDATGTTAGPLTSRPFHELGYTWDFGDPGSGSWSTTGRSRNEASGPVAAHVFETPGTYTVTLTVRSGLADTDTVQTTITVQDPDEVYAGTDTIVISRTTNFSGAPAGATQVTTTSFSEAMNHLATGKRVLLKRGQSWTTSSSTTINMAGPGTLGAFGSGARPRITATFAGDVFRLSGSSAALDDWRILDLEITGSGAQGLNAMGRVSRTLIQGMNLHGLEDGIHATENIISWWNSHGAPQDPHDALAVVDCEINDYQVYGALLAASRLMYLGNSSDGNSNIHEHVLRVQYADKGVIAENHLVRGSHTKHVVKLHAPRWDNADFGPGEYTEQVVVSGNIFQAGVDAWTVAVAPENSSYDERLRDVIVERNHFLAGSSTQVALYIHAVDVTARNNIFDLTNGVYVNSIQVTQRSSSPPSSNTHLLNNTFFRADSGSFNGVDVTSSVSNTVIKNNLASAPNASSPTLYKSSGSGTDVSNNLLTTSPGWVSRNPSSPNDFRPKASSPAVDAGVHLPAVQADYAGQPSHGAPDLGAFEHIP